MRPALKTCWFHLFFHLSAFPRLLFLPCWSGSVVGITTQQNISAAQQARTFRHASGRCWYNNLLRLSGAHKQFILPPFAIDSGYQLCSSHLVHSIQKHAQSTVSCTCRRAECSASTWNWSQGLEVGKDSKNYKGKRGRADFFPPGCQNY